MTEPYEDELGIITNVTTTKELGIITNVTTTKSVAYFITRDVADKRHCCVVPSVPLAEGTIIVLSSCGHVHRSAPHPDEGRSYLVWRRIKGPRASWHRARRVLCHELA